MGVEGGGAQDSMLMQHYQMHMWIPTYPLQYPYSVSIVQKMLWENEQTTYFTRGMKLLCVCVTCVPMYICTSTILLRHVSGVTSGCSLVTILFVTNKSVALYFFGVDSLFQVGSRLESVGAGACRCQNVPRVFSFLF